MSTRTVSIRLESELIQRIDDKCNTEGCCRNDFVKKAIINALDKEKIPVAKVTKVSYDDGKTWIDVD